MRPLKVAGSNVVILLLFNSKAVKLVRPLKVDGSMVVILLLFKSKVVKLVRPLKVVCEHFFITIIKVINYLCVQ